MAQPTSKVKEMLGDNTKCCAHTNQCAIITYCLVAIVQHDMQLKSTTYEVLHILSISLTAKKHLQDLFDKTNFNNIKEKLSTIIPGLFD